MTAESQAASNDNSAAMVISLFILTVMICATLFVCVTIYTGSNRYEITGCGSTTPVAYMLDKKTGDAWMLSIRGKERVEEKY